MENLGWNPLILAIDARKAPMRQRTRPAAAFGRCWRQKGVSSPVPPSSPKPAHRKDKRHCPRGHRLCPNIFDNANGNGSGTFSGTVSRATVKHHRAMPQAWPCFSCNRPFRWGSFSMFRGKSPEGSPRAPCPLQQDEPRHRPQRPPPLQQAAITTVRP